MRQDGLFVILEGADGCGKSTILIALLAHLSTLGMGRKMRRVNRGVRGASDPGGAIVEAVRRLFESVDDKRVPEPMLGIAAAAQYSALLYTQVAAPLLAGDIVIADSWWGKTSARLELEARRCGMGLEDAADFGMWLRSLLPKNLVPADRQLTILIETPQEDRVNWYSQSADPEIVYDEEGQDSRDPEVYGVFSSQLQELLRGRAVEHGWAVFQNGTHRRPAEVAHEIGQLIAAHLDIVRR